MNPHPPLSVLFLEDDPSPLEPLISYLQSIRHLDISVLHRLPADLSRFDAVVTGNLHNDRSEPRHLTRYVENGASWLILMHLSENPLPEIFGVQPEPVGPAAELRILFESKNRSLADRLPDAIYLRRRYQALQKRDDTCETTLHADWRHTHRPMLTCRSVGKGRAACTTLQAHDNRMFQRILYRLIRWLAGHAEPQRELGVGLLQKIALPAREDYPFHRNLADHLLTGEPIAAPLEDSVKVVAILETAARSMARSGTVEVFHEG